MLVNKVTAPTLAMATTEGATMEFDTAELEGFWSLARFSITRMEKFATRR